MKSFRYYADKKEAREIWWPFGTSPEEIWKWCKKNKHIQFMDINSRCVTNPYFNNKISHQGAFDALCVMLRMLDNFPEVDYDEGYLEAICSTSLPMDDQGAADVFFCLVMCNLQA